MNDRVIYESAIGQFAPVIKAVVLEDTDSTNREAKRLAAEGAPQGTAVIALRQTAGRGRLGRSFFSPVGGIYLSLILRPAAEAQAALRITTAAAVAAAESIERVSGRSCLIKWVNDIYIDERKVCGILTEGAINAADGTLEYAILGVGINTSLPEKGFPEDIADKAGAVFDKPVSHEVKAKLIGEFARSFFAYYSSLENRSYMTEYKKRSFLDGRSVSYSKNGSEHFARVIGVDDNAGLVLEENGITTVLAAGEVSVKL